jgi:poly-gamma-glutamate capsule biosynthesis protein CapA/YwtB (metallophosphatase superfamily)
MLDNSAQTGNQPITLGFVGDIALNDAVLEGLPSDDLRSVFSGVDEILGRCDLVVGNLECAIRPDMLPRHDTEGVLTAPPEICGCFDDTPIQVLSLANNHIQDAGPEGIDFTRRTLEGHGISHFGAGLDESQASRHVVSECKGWKIGFLGASGFSYANARGARPGAAPLQNRRLLQSVRELKSTCDLVVVVVHADLEFVDYPAPWRVRLSRRLIDAGAGLVIHHHPHVLQGGESYRNGFVAYSLGNWVFKTGDYQAVSEETNYSALLEVTVSRDQGDGALGLVTKFHPVKISDNGLPQALKAGPEAQRISQRITTLSERYRDRRRISRAWHQTCKTEAKRTFFEIYYMAAREGIFIAGKRLQHVLGQQLTWKWIRGLLLYGKF